MCAINPSHKKRFILDVYTFNPKITKEEFEQAVINKAQEKEIELNEDASFRWHIKETKQEAD